ncbi:C1q-like domain-containing protein [Kordia sp.]|uniref:C1q-like domain-containing protein n=1 Tax=Kordia sp. TaxID=1965332 RepID=UPI003D6BA3DF
MKKITLLLCFMVGVFSISHAQNFNYQAAIRDNAGALVSNQSIGIQIKLLQGSATGSIIYTETHTTTSNAHGIISLTIGSGTTTDSFNSINWSAQNYWLETAVDITGGSTYVVIGSSQLMSVPYANHATTSADKALSTTANVTSNRPGTIATDDFVFGSTQLADDINTTDDNTRMFFDKSKGALRAGFAEGTEWDDSNVGLRSIAFGTKNTVSGFQSFAMGTQNTVSGPTSATFGANNNITGIATFSTGEFLTAEARSQVTIGYLNTAEAGNALIKVPTDRLFVIGNGFDEMTRSDALVMLKNGNTTLNGQLTIDGDNQGTGTSYTLPAQDGVANQILATDGSGTTSWVNAPTVPVNTFSTTANVTSNANGTVTTDDFVFGSIRLNDDGIDNSGDESRLFFDKSKGAFRAGTATQSDGYGGGWDTNTVGDYSVAFGRGSIASNTGAMAVGSYNVANGENAFAAGHNNLASRPSSIALGTNNSVSGTYAVGLGVGSQATSFAQQTIGMFSEGFASTSHNTYVATDPLFVIGNGSSDITRSNALVMTKNGHTTLNGQLTIDGDNTGVGASYTLPAQDGTANQVLTTDGSGNVSWAAVAAGVMLPSGGTDGQLLKTDGSGNYAWVTDAVNDADSDPTNEIELPVQSGQAGKILSTNGTTPSWTSDVQATSVTTNALTVNNLPAFAADLNGTKVLSGAGGYVQLSGWRTADAALPRNLFDNGNHFNETTGVFTAPVNGFYYFTAQVRYDAIDSGYVRLLLGVNGAISLQSGLHAIAEVEEAAEAINYQTLNVGGVMKLNANDTVSVVIYSSSDTSWNINDESGFNGYLISRF